MSTKTVFALCDANTFYAKCEEIFRPELRGKPIVVLSNNDGCVIAQNAEAKAILELYMCRPWFEIEEQANALGVIAFSSNYELYGNMSTRFMETLKQFTFRQEVYSIDESFLDMTGINRNLTEYGHEIKRTVRQWTKLPICVGFGHTKTLAKLANHCAKKQPLWEGVCDLTSLPQLEVEKIMESLPVSKVWGVGKRLEAKLNQHGVHSVLRLKKANLKRIRDEFGVVLERTIKELNGEVLLDLELELPEAKQIMSSRSFGARVHKLEDLEQSISMHAANAARRMRMKGLYANAVYVFCQNSPYDQAPYYPGHKVIGLPAPTDSTTKITKAALYALRQAYKPDVYYQKAGVMLMELVPKEGQQLDLLDYTDNDERSDRLMTALDKVNAKYGKGTVKLGSEGTHHSWAMRREFKSPNYTTQWKDLPKVRAG